MSLKPPPEPTTKTRDIPESLGHVFLLIQRSVSQVEMMWLGIARPSIYSGGFICTSCLCYVRPVLLLTLHSNNIPLLQIPQIPNRICVSGEHWDGSFQGKHCLPFTRLQSLNKVLLGWMSQERATAHWCMHQRCLWAVETCLLVFPSTTLAIIITNVFLPMAVIKSVLVEQTRQMGFVVHASTAHRRSPRANTDTLHAVFTPHVDVITRYPLFALNPTSWSSAECKVSWIN